MLAVRLVFDQKARSSATSASSNNNNNRIYTLEMILKPGIDTDVVRKRVMDPTGMTPAFYLQGTKMIVSHTLDLEFLKRINDLDFVVSIKGSPYSAGGSSDF